MCKCVFEREIERQKETGNVASGCSSAAESVELRLDLVKKSGSFIERPGEIRFVFHQYIAVRFLQT